MALGPANKRLGYNDKTYYCVSRRRADGVYDANNERVAATEERDFDI